MTPDARLSSFLAETDTPCPVCGFNLRGVTSANCPECGVALHLAVASSNKRLAPFTLAVVALAMGLGFDAVVLTLFSVAAVIGLIFGQSLPSVWQPYVLPASLTLGVIGTGIGILALLRGQRSWFRARPRVQWWRAIGIFIAVFLAHAGFGVVTMLIY